MSLDALAPLSVPVPPMLEQALGYNGSARLVAFYWSPGGDKAMFDDGVIAADAERPTYLGWLEHPRLAPLLSVSDLGSTEQEARQWLLLDREARVLYALPAREAAGLLYQQWATRPAAPSGPESADESAAVLKAFTEEVGWQDIPVDLAAVESRRQEQGALLSAMLEWLDQQAAGQP